MTVIRETTMTTPRVAEHVYDEIEMSGAERAQMGRQHVLCVNGSVVFLEFVWALLEEESYNVTTTNFVPSTFDLISALRPNLLIMDLEVGKRAGWDLLEHLKRAADTITIPLIIVSTDQKLLDRARNDIERLGGSQFIGKPFDINELLDAVHALIGVA